jgi:hypothetical protein
MKSIIQLTTLLSIIVSPAFAGSTNFHGSEGSYQGSMQSAGQNNSFIYGPNGEYVGSTAKAGNSIYYYRSDGAYVGFSQSTVNISAE